MVAELQDDPVKGVDGRDIPEMRCLQVDDDALQCFLAKIEGGVEGFCRGEEDLPAHPVGPHIALAAGGPDGEELRDLVSEEQPTQDYPEQHALGEVVGR